MKCRRAKSRRPPRLHLRRRDGEDFTRASEGGVNVRANILPADLVEEARFFHYEERLRVRPAQDDVFAFAMQSLDHSLCYGKRIFGQRAGIAIHDRVPSLRPTAFGLACAADWASRSDQSISSFG